MKIYASRSSNQFDRLVGTGVWVRISADRVGILPYEDDYWVPFAHPGDLYWFRPDRITKYSGKKVYEGHCTRSYAKRNEDYTHIDFMTVPKDIYAQLTDDESVHYIYADDLEVLSPLEIATTDELFTPGEN